MKIVYCLDNIQETGGIEKVIREKANFLAEKNGFEIYVVVSDFNPKLPLNLNDKIKFILLGINYYSSNCKSYLHFLYSITFKRLQHLTKLKKQFRNIKPDIIISPGLSEKFLLPLIKGKAKLIREYHFSKNYRKLAYSNCKLLYRIIASFADFIDNRIFLKRYDSIVTLTQEDKDENWRDYDNVIIINNPISKMPAEGAVLENKKIIAIGRLVRQKNFSSLIRAFSKVSPLYPDWTLEIYGEGNEKDILKKLIDELKMDGKVLLKGNVSNIDQKLLDSAFLVMSSKYEGMPMVLLEAMACGLPLLSYECPCGPKDLIGNNKNGLLIERDNEAELAEKMIFLIENENIRKEFGEESYKKAKDFTIDKIMEKWETHFNHLLKP